MKFRKKPVVIEATQFFPDQPWPAGVYETVLAAFNDRPDCTRNVAYGIKTLEGAYQVTPGDWIITGIAGELYPCKPEIFAKTYEPVEPS